MIRDIVNSCSNDHVARAALLSIGGGFAAAVRGEARRVAVAPESFAAREVERFGRFATPEDVEELRGALVGSPMPVLTGFRFIVERSLARQSDLPDAAVIAACADRARGRACGA